MLLKAEIQSDMKQMVRVWPGVSSLLIGLMLVVGLVSFTNYLNSDTTIDPDSLTGLALAHSQVMYLCLFAICILGIALGFVGIFDAKKASRLKQAKDGVQLRYAAAILGGESQ